MEPYGNFLIRIELNDTQNIIPASNDVFDIYVTIHDEMSVFNFSREIEDEANHKYYELPRAVYWIISDEDISVILEKVIKATLNAFKKFNTQKNADNHFSVMVAGRNKIKFYNLKEVS